jgi:hypothetical protein
MPRAKDSAREAMPKIAPNKLDLFNTASHRTPFLDAGGVMRQVEHWRVVVAISDADTKRTEARQRRRPPVFCLHCHTILRRDSDLELNFKHRREMSSCFSVTGVTPLVLHTSSFTRPVALTKRKKERKNKNYAKGVVLQR